MISYDDWRAISLTFELALISTLILIVIGTPISWWLSQTKLRFKFLVESPPSAKVFKELTLIVLENMLYIILISSAALALGTLKNN